MPFIESFGGLLLVLGSVLILRAAWRADVGETRAIARARTVAAGEPLEHRRAA